VNNSPLNYVDPAGHCAVDSNGNILVDPETGEIVKTDCTVDDFLNLSWEQRLEWLKLFVSQNDLADWFDDIKNAIEFMMDDPNLSDASGAANYMDAAVLQAINDGWNVVTGGTAIGEAGIDGADGWASFFQKWRDCRETGMCGDGNWLLDDRVEAEQIGVDYAQTLTYAPGGAYDRDDIRSKAELDWFLLGANGYRAVGTRLGPLCAGVCDPRTAGPGLREFASWAGPRWANLVYGFYLGAVSYPPFY